MLHTCEFLLLVNFIVLVLITSHVHFKQTLDSPKNIIYLVYAPGCCIIVCITAKRRDFSVISEPSNISQHSAHSIAFLGKLEKILRVPGRLSKIQYK